MIGTTVNINNIDFKIININIYQDSVYSVYMGGNNFVDSKRTIKIQAETSTDNYIKINKWFDEINSSVYKKDLIFNTVQIIGIFPVDYTFNQDHIDIALSVDYIDGDMELFNLQKLRKRKIEKLEVINKIKYSK